MSSRLHPGATRRALLSVCLFEGERGRARRAPAAALFCKLGLTCCGPSYLSVYSTDNTGVSAVTVWTRRCDLISETGVTTVEKVLCL